MSTQHQQHHSPGHNSSGGSVAKEPPAPVSSSHQQHTPSGSGTSRQGNSTSSSSSSAAARQQRALFKPFLHTLRGYASSPSSTPNNSDPSSSTAQSNGSNNNNNSANHHHHHSSGSGGPPPLIIHAEATPSERETGKLSRSGRQLSEMEILQEKHEPEFRRLMPVVASALKDVVAIHEPLRAFAPPDDRYSYYETNAPPGISIDAYVQRIAEYTYISPSTLLVSLMILDRLAGRHPTLLFTTLNIYKLFFVAVRISSKVVDLRTLNNKNFAPVGGISNRHLNDVEARMLIDLRFDLYISPADFKAYVKRATDGVPQPIAISSSFQRAMAQMQASQRATTPSGKPEPGDSASSSSDGQNNANPDQFSHGTSVDQRLPPNPAALNPSENAAPLAL